METAISLLLLLIPVVVIGVLVYRLRAVVRIIRDPEQLATLLSPRVRNALEDAGIDPAKISLADVETNQELKDLVSADLRAGIIRKLTRPNAGALDATSVPLDYGQQRDSLPPPIDGSRTSDRVRNWILAIVIAGAVAAFAWSWL